MIAAERYEQELSLIDKEIKELSELLMEVQFGIEDAWKGKSADSACILLDEAQKYLSSAGNTCKRVDYISRCIYES